MSLALTAIVLALTACSTGSADSTEGLAPAMFEEGVALPTAVLGDRTTAEEIVDKWSEPNYLATPEVDPELGYVVDQVTGEVLGLNAALEQACARFDTSNYDVTDTLWIGEDGDIGNVVTEYKVSGDDLQSVTILYVVGFFPVAQTEVIRRMGCTTSGKI